MLRPKLFSGARVALLCPSGTISAERLKKAADAVRRLGLVAVQYDSALSEYGYLAGEDKVRADDINNAFADYTIDGILCLRGGYGATRILPMLDLVMIKRRPKFFCGYSDITALSNVFTQKCGFMTYHGIMPAADYYDGCDDYSMESLKRAMFADVAGEVENPDGMQLNVLSGGKAEGELCGGNLCVMTYLLGTPWEMDTRGKIIFIEDVGEQPYRIDAMLTHMRNAGKFDDCAGIIFGYFTDCAAKENERSFSIEQIICDIVLPCGKPVISNFACGHEMPSATLPIGATVAIDGGKIAVL